MHLSELLPASPSKESHKPAPSVSAQTLKLLELSDYEFLLLSFPELPRAAAGMAIGSEEPPPLSALLYSLVTLLLGLRPTPTQPPCSSLQVLHML